MLTLDYWRCPACSRILAEQVVVGGIGSLTAVCWGCGETARLPERILGTRIGGEMVVVVGPPPPPFFELADDKANLGTVRPKKVKP